MPFSAGGADVGFVGLGFLGWVFVDGEAVAGCAAGVDVFWGCFVWVAAGQPLPCGGDVGLDVVDDVVVTGLGQLVVDEFCEGVCVPGGFDSEPSWVSFRSTD